MISPPSPGRQRLPDPTNDDREIYTAVKELFNKTWKKGKPVRLLGVGVTQFDNPVKQLSLWDVPNKKDANLFTAVDDVRNVMEKIQLCVAVI